MGVSEQVSEQVSERVREREKFFDVVITACMVQCHKCVKIQVF